MKKRWFLRLALVAILGTAGFVAFLLTQPRSPINLQNFEKIQIGMTLAEVEAIIGLSPGDYSTGDLILIEQTTQIGNERRVVRYDTNEPWEKKISFRRKSTAKTHKDAWTCDTGLIWLWFDPNDLVFAKHFASARRSYDSIWHAIRGWMRL